MNPSHTPSSSAEVLLSLRKIRSALQQDSDAANQAQQECISLRNENEELRRKMGKLEYRIKHLLRELETPCAVSQS